MLNPITLHEYATAAAMGQQAGEHAAQVIRQVQQSGTRPRVMLAAAPSQTPTLTALAAADDIDFAAIDFFHMDDYVGLAPDAPQWFGNWLDRILFARLSGATLHRIDTTADPDQSAAQYAELLGDQPFDLTLCGLGVNAHLAFNDPPADFHDQQSVRVVTLDQVSRRQQVDEGHFPDLDSVPAQAITVTIPRLLNTGHIICSVIGAQKRQAVINTVTKDPDPSVPGSALKLHQDAHLYVDRDAYPG